MMIKVKYVYETAYQECTEEVENEGKQWNSHDYHLRYMQEKRNKQRRKIIREQEKQEEWFGRNPGRSCKKELVQLKKKKKTTELNNQKIIGGFCQYQLNIVKRTTMD